MGKIVEIVLHHNPDDTNNLLDYHKQVDGWSTCGYWCPIRPIIKIGIIKRFAINYKNRFNYCLRYLYNHVVRLLPKQLGDK